MRASERPKLKNPRLQELSRYFERLRRGQSDPGKAVPVMNRLLVSIDEELEALELDLDTTRIELKNATRPAPPRPKKRKPKANSKGSSDNPDDGVVKQSDDPAP